MSIKLSHEVPLCMLKESKSFNDYDYALVHLFEECPDYYQFYEDSVKEGRHVLLDNSLFELGKAFEEERFSEWVKKLKPTEYIIPDSMNNAKETIDNLHSWMAKYNNLPGKKIGVVQGADFEEMVMCYKELAKYVDKIAISFGYKYFSQNNFNIEGNKWKIMCDNRQKFIDTLIDYDIIDKSKPHHLLGNALPIEFKHYSSERYSFIETIDTSNPIIHGILNIRYKEDGLQEKESIKMVELFNAQITPEQKEVINYNINKFREINHI